MTNRNDPLRRLADLCAKEGPKVYDRPDQGFDVVITNDNGEVSMTLPPVNNVHIDVAIKRVIGLLAMLEDIREQHGNRSA